MIQKIWEMFQDSEDVRKMLEDLEDVGGFRRCWKIWKMLQDSEDVRKMLDDLEDVG